MSRVGRYLPMLPAHVDRPGGRSGARRAGGPGRPPAMGAPPGAARARQGSFQVQRSISVVKPGPNARIKPAAPSRGRRWSKVRRSTSNTTTLETLPTSRRLCHDRSSRSARRSRPSATARSTAGPPVWQSTNSRSPGLTPCWPRKRSTTGMTRGTVVRTLGLVAKWKPRSLVVPAMTWVEPGTRCCWLASSRTPGAASSPRTTAAAAPSPNSSARMGAQEVVGLRQRGVAGRAAELLDGQAPDGGAQPQLAGDVGVGAGQHVTGAGDDHQGVDVDGVDPRGRQRALPGARAELDGMGGVELVAGAEALVVEGVVQ